MTRSRRDLLGQTEAVESAARRLLESVQQRAPASRVDLHVDALERAARTQDEATARTQAFLFEALEARPTAPRAAPATVDDVLAVAAADLEVATVLLAAGNAVGEQGDARDPRLLDEAIGDLGRATRELGDAGRPPAALGFAGERVPRSPDLPAAIAAFHAKSDEVLDALTSKLGGIAGAVAGKLPLGDLVRAVGDLGGKLPDVVGRLAALARRKVARALEALGRLVGETAIAALREPLEQVVAKLQDRGVRGVLASLVEVEETAAHVRRTVTGTGLDRDRVDRGTAELDALVPRYERSVRYVDLAITAATVVNAIGAHTAQPLLTSIGASVLVMALLVAVAVAKDYADSETWLRFVRGVREIAEDAAGRA